MKPQEAGIHTLSLLKHFGLRDWRVRLIPEFRDCPACPGYCHWKHRAIELNTSALRDADAAHVRNVILHEIAHALVGEVEAHGSAFWQTLHTIEACPDVARAWDAEPTFEVYARPLEQKKPAA